MNFSDKLWALVDEANRAAGRKLSRQELSPAIDDLFKAESAAKKKGKVPLAKMSRDELLQFFQQDQGLAALNVEIEMRNCERWWRVRKARAPSPKGYVNWMNKAASDHAVRNSVAPGAGPKKTYDGPPGWRQKAKALFPGATIDFDRAEAWAMLPASAQDQITKAS